MRGPGRTPARAVAAGCALALVVLSATPSSAVSTERAVSTELPAYQFTVRAAPVETYVRYFRELDSDAGYSRVQLAHRWGEAQAQARALGAVYWLLTDDEPCLLGCEPPCPEGVPPNPTVEATSDPNECPERVPGISALGLRPDVTGLVDAASKPAVTARTPSEVSATGSARVVDLSGTLGVTAGMVGSTSTGSVDRSTGAFAGVARSFVADVTLPGGELATVTSMLGVVDAPGSIPKVDYLLSVAAGGGAGATSEVNRQAFTIAGRQVPLVDLVRRVNLQLAALGSQLAALADLGVRVLPPAADYATPGPRFRVSAPVVVLGAEPDLSWLPVPTGDSGVRLANAVFEGNYAEPDPPLR